MPQHSCICAAALTEVGMSLEQAQSVYSCLPAFTMTEHWLQQPKCFLAMFLASAKLGRHINHHKMLAN